MSYPISLPTPSGWTARKLKHLASTGGGMTPSKDRADFWDGDIPWVSPKDMKQPVLADSQDHISRTALAETGIKLHPADGVLVVTRGMILAHTFPVARNSVPVTVNQDMKVLRPVVGVDSRYLAWMLEGLEPAMLALTDESAHGTKALRTDQWANLAIPVPFPGLQVSIANFLDEQTTRIDALIAEKQRLVERLAELEHSFGDDLFRRRAGERGTVRLKYRSPQVTVGIVVTPAKYYVESGIPSLRSLNVGQGELKSDSLVFISPEANELHAKSKIFEGDLVIVRSGKPGATAVVSKEFDGGNCIDLVIIRRSVQVNSHWLRAYLNSAPALEQVTDASDGAIQQHFNVASARELRIPDSPLDEQAADLETMTQKQQAVRSLTTHVCGHIERLQEFRSSLITAAVTGHLDIRTFKLAA